VVRPLEVRLWVAGFGWLASLTLLIGAFVATETLTVAGALTGLASLGAWIEVGGLYLGFAAAVVVGQLGLVMSFPEVATGSGIPSIVGGLRRGRRIAALSLLAGFWPASVAVYLVATGSTDFSAAYWILPGLIGPLGLTLGISWTAEAYDEWTDLADRVYGYGSSPQDDWFQSDVGRGPLGGGSRWGSRSRGAHPGVLRWSAPRVRWTLAGVLGAVALTALVFLSASGWLAPALHLVPTTPTPGPPPLPSPIVIAPRGTIWAIPVGHYEYESFRLNGTASLTGNFTATGPVEGYAMDSLDYTRWQVVGSVVSDQYDTGNVTSGGFHVPLGFNDRWYVILANESPSTEVFVTWSSECVVVYSG
jgi:hypothetical protein